MKLRLRAHHLLCLQGFQGYGYDSSFVKNMTRINEIRKMGNVSVTVCDCPDDICQKCPNLKNNICVDEKRIVEMDRKVLEKLPKTNFEDSIDLFDLFSTIFTSMKSVEGICNNCRWSEECLFIQSL